NASAFVWSGSKCTVTPVYPATVWRTSRRFFSAAARAMARVLSAVSSRVPSSARSAVSPSGWTRNLVVERGGGMCAHKGGGEDAGHDANAQQGNAGQTHSPGGDDGGGGKVPGREIAQDSADGSRKVEEVDRTAAGREANRRVRHQQQHGEPPGQGQDEPGGQVGVQAPKRRVGDVPQVSRLDPPAQRCQGQREWGCDEKHRDRDPEAVGEQTARQRPA